MITVKYNSGYIELLPSTSEENLKLIKLFADSNVRYSDGSWLINEKDLDWANHCLVPLRSILFIEKSFKEWREGTSSEYVIIRCNVVTSNLLRRGVTLPTKDLEEATRYFWKPAANHPKYKAGTWDGYINLYKRWEHSFPTGLLHEVEAVLTQKGIPYKIEYAYEREPEKQFDWEVCDGIIPDPDQVEAVEACIKGKRGICKSPTGFGRVA